MPKYEDSFKHETCNSVLKNKDVIDSIPEEIKSIKEAIKDIKNDQLILHRKTMNICNEPIYNILVLEEDISYTSFICQSVKNYGYAPTTLRSVIELRSHLNRKKFDVIILSIRLNNIKNIISFIRSLDSSIVILLTINKGPSGEIFKVLPEINGVIYKPFLENELIDHIKKAVIRSKMTIGAKVNLEQ